MRDIGTAIDFLHNINIAHRDVKVLKAKDKHPNPEEYDQFCVVKGHFVIFSFLLSRRTCCTRLKKATQFLN